MSFNVPADAYDRFMGRYSALLSPKLADIAGVAAGQRVLDVGCGPGALLAELIRRAGADAVSAVDPSEPFVAAARERFPRADIQPASAEQLPFSDATFDATLAQLVVHFMDDPVRGLGEMRRVTRRGGVVAACVWDHAGDRGPLSLFWRAAIEVDPTAVDESQLAGSGHGQLGNLFRSAGLRDVEETTISADLDHPTFEEWWEPYTGGVGPAGVYVRGLTPDQREVLRERCRSLLGPAPFTVTALAWTARGVA
jgi:SAM-dependent methyltransferase